MPTAIADDGLHSSVATKSDEMEVQKEHIFRSKLPDIPLPSNILLNEYIFQRTSHFLERTFLIEEKSGKTMSYGEVQAMMRRVVAGLVKLGIGKGDVVMLLLPNCSLFVPLFLGIVARGAIVTTANPLFSQREVTKQAKACKVKLFITRSDFVHKLPEVQSGESLLTLTLDPPPEGSSYQSISLLTEADDNSLENGLSEAEKIDPNDTAVLPYSSGTTGLPKGVRIKQSSMVMNVAQQVEGENPHFYIDREDVVLCVLPMFHMYSLMVLLCCMRVGTAMVVVERYEIGRLMEACERYRVSVAPLVPPIVLAIAKNPEVSKYDLSSIRALISGAAPLGKELEQSIQARLPSAVIAQMYGMTEAGPMVATSLAFAKYPCRVKPGSCGMILRNFEMKITDIETGESCGYNKAGEICIRGPTIMQGYLDDPHSTALAIDKDGWLHTGDVGYVDEDEDLFIIDRIKEIIKYKGFQVSPAELEAILISHPSIEDGAVVGQADEIAGDVPIAYVVRSSNVSEDEIKNFVAEQVIYYKRLHHIYFIESIPKSPSGKILRKCLRAN